MKKSALLALALLAPYIVLAAMPRSIALVIQENGNVQVSETHDIEPAGPDGLVRISPLPETLVATSVNATPADRSDNLDIAAQRFAYDLRNDTTLFHAYVGETITCHGEDDPVTGRLATLPDFAAPHPALMLEAAGQTVHYIPDIFALESIEFPSRPALSRQPTLLWQLAAGQMPPPSVQLNYAATGISWSAAHEAILAEDSRSFALASRVRIQNKTSRDFVNARVRLALTEKGLYTPLVPAAEDPRAAKPSALRYGADGASWVPERLGASAGIVATYDLPQALTLPAGGDVRAGLVTAPAVAAETRLVYDGVRFDRYQRNRRNDWNLGTESTSIVETRLSFQNALPTPLPPGEFRLLRGRADKTLDWIGTDWLPALKPGESATINLGPAAGLTGRRLRTAYSDVVPFKVAEETFEITVENQTAAAQTVTVIEHFYRGDNHQITAASAEYTPGTAPHSIQFDVPVKPGSSQSLTYTVRYTW